jgi:hypothetical protein
MPFASTTSKVSSASSTLSLLIGKLTVPSVLPAVMTSVPPVVAV